MSEALIKRLDYANSTLPESQVFKGGDGNKEVPIRFFLYLVKTSDRLILIDAGCVTMPGFIMRNFIGPVKALEAVGVSPLDITDVFITHNHHDHIECVSEFKNSSVYIQTDEYNGGRNHFTPDMKVISFENELEIAKGIRAVKIAGHSKGSSVFEIDTDDGTAVFAGDECYSRKNFTERILSGICYSEENNRKFFERYSDSKYTLYFGHD